MVDIFDIIKKDICMPVAITGEVFSNGVPYNKHYIKRLSRYLFENKDEVELVTFETERSNMFNEDDEDYFLKFTIVANVTEDLYDKIMMDIGDFIGYYDIELNKIMNDYSFDITSRHNERRRVLAGDLNLGSHDADGDVIPPIEFSSGFRPVDMRTMFQNATLNLDESILSGRR